MTQSAAHTPGPWSVTSNSWQYTTIYDADKSPVCVLDLEDWDVTEETQDALEKRQAEVARLISAAPDMLTTLRELEEFLDNQAVVDDERPNDAMRHLVEVRAAIRKAEGR